MKSNEKLNKLKNIFSSMIRFLFLTLTDLLKISLVVFTLFGATASLILLYKMFPETAVLLLEPLALICEILIRFVVVFAIGVWVFLCGYFIILVVEFFEKENEKGKLEREKERKKFIKEVVGRLKKDTKTTR